MYIQQTTKFSAIERTKEEKDLVVLVIILIMMGYQFDEAVKNANAILKH